MIVDCDGKPYTFGLDPNAPGAMGNNALDQPPAERQCDRCGDVVPSDLPRCTAIADCQNFKLRSTWIIRELSE